MGRKEMNRQNDCTTKDGIYSANEQREDRTEAVILGLHLNCVSNDCSAVNHGVLWCFVDYRGINMMRCFNVLYYLCCTVASNSSYVSSLTKCPAALLTLIFQ